MMPKQVLQKFAADVTKRCGICQATVEQVLPAVFDEIRCRLVEGRYPCIPIDSFGTFAVINVPEREYMYHYKGIRELRTLPPAKRLKFAMARNMKRELQEGRFDPTRKSFSRHPDDPIIRRRRELRYQKPRPEIYKSTTIYKKEKDDQ